jgi:hypothetical protein
MLDVEEMRMLTPAQYAERYWNLEVPFDDGPVTVRIDQYRLGEPKPGSVQAKDDLFQGLKDLFQQRQRDDKTWQLTLQVNSATKDFASPQSLSLHVARPFYGKGSPEDCQIVLQLAVLVAKKHKPRKDRADLQSYCDTHLGLDCNGFVGNYLWHERAGNSWDTEAGNRNVGPSSTIDSIMKSGHFISKIEDMNAAKTHLLAQVDGANVIIPGGARVGHITMTEPNRYMSQSFVFNSFGGLDLRMATRQNIYGHPAYWVLESTGGKGLVDSWYAFQPVQDRRGRDVPGVFKVFRGSKGTELNVRVASLA